MWLSYSDWTPVDSPYLRMGWCIIVAPVRLDSCYFSLNLRLWRMVSQTRLDSCWFSPPEAWLPQSDWTPVTSFLTWGCDAWFPKSDWTPTDPPHLRSWRIVAPVRLDSFKLAAKLTFCGFLYTTFLGVNNNKKHYCLSAWLGRCSCVWNLFFPYQFCCNENEKILHKI